MNTREIATEYRLSHWAALMRERKESGLSVKAFCENAGFHENIYYYWQRKLREATSLELIRVQEQTARMTPTGFREVKLAVEPNSTSEPETQQNRVCIETGGIRITADGGYPADKLSVILREVSRSC
jgi:transposase-like protein